MLIVIYAEYRNKPYMLGSVKLIVIMLIVVTPKKDKINLKKYMFNIKTLFNSI